VNNTVFEALRAWVHESPLSICTAGSDTCDDYELAETLADLVAQAGTPLEGVARQRAVDAAARSAGVLRARAAR
jgi:hypothetical protein